MLFSLFFILSVRVIYLYLLYENLTHQVICLVISIAIVFLTWINARYAIYGFIAIIPVINGIQILNTLHFFPPLELFFAVMYIAWFVKRICLGKGNIQPNSNIGNLIDVLVELWFYRWD